MRWVAVSLPVVAAGVALACTTFDFPAPDAGSGDASPDASPDAEGGPPSAQLLSMSDSVLLCAQVFRCPRLDEAIELSMALPLATPATPLGFSACMDWVAGPIDPARLGLASQQKLLHDVALAGSCADAYAALPVQPIDAGACGPGCPDDSDLQICSQDAGAFLLPCRGPYFGQSGVCYSDDAGLAACLSPGSCTIGLTCSDTSTLAECFTAKGGGVFTQYDCTLSGRQCATQGNHLADCVVPPQDTAPCPLQDVRDSCDGASVLHCAGGRSAQTELSCAAVGRGCSTQNPAGVARCVGSGDVCTPFDVGIDQCTGVTISLCVGGAKQSFDCSSSGLQCVPGTAEQTGHCG